MRAVMVLLLYLCVLMKLFINPYFTIRLCSDSR